MNTPSKKLQAIAFEHDDGVITAYIKELPGLVVQGKTQEEIKLKLHSLVEVFIQKLQASRNNIEVVTKSVA